MMTSLFGIFFALVGMQRQTPQVPLDAEHMSPTRIDVGTEDMKNVAAVLRKGTALTVRVFREGTTLSQTLPLGVRLIPIDSQPSQFTSSQNESNVSVKPNAEASIPELIKGRYFVSVAGLQINNYVSDIRQGAKTVFDDGFIALSSDSSDSLEVIIRSGGGTIQGRINSDGKG